MQETPEEHADRLKERVYLTFTTLAVVIALRSHEGDADSVATTLAIVVSGTVLAGVVSHVVAHVVAYAALPDRRELTRLARVTGGALASLVLPALFVLLAVNGTWPIDRSLRASTTALVVALGVIGWFAARRARLPGWQQALVLLVEVAVGALVVALELWAHG